MAIPSSRQSSNSSPSSQLHQAVADAGDDTPAATRPWEDLPDDCWDTIFTHLHHRDLNPLSRVCKRFLAISNACNPAVTLPPAVTAPSLLFSRFPNLKSIHVRHTHPDIDAFVRQLAASPLRLQSLHLDAQTHFPAGAMQVLSSSKRSTLRSLALTNFHHFNERDLLAVADVFPYLHRLDLDGSGYWETITDEAVIELSTKLVSMVSFTFTTTSFHSVSRRSVECLSSNCLLTDLKARFFSKSPIDIGCFSTFTSLTSLHLEGVVISLTGLDQLSRARLKQVKLNLSNPRNSNIDGAAMCRFLESCHSLGDLVLCRIRFMSSCCLGACIPQSVRVIEIQDCENLHNTLFDVLRSCPRLEQCRLQSANFVTMKFKDLFNLPVHNRLRELTLESNSFSDVILLICLSCPKLESFRIQGDCRITKQGIEAIIKAKCCIFNCFKEEHILNFKSFFLYQDKA